MSHYIYTHPKETYIDERRVIWKTAIRRELAIWIIRLLLFKAFITYKYRHGRLKIYPKNDFKGM